jgi:hypothetical protein
VVLALALLGTAALGLLAASPAVADAGPTVTNDPPLAEAGLDRRVTQGAAVALDATGSRDPDGEIAAYRWRVTAPNGSTVAPDCRDCPRTAFDARRPGIYEVTLTVRDDDGATDTDTLYVTVETAAPPSVSVTGPTDVTADEPHRYTASLDRGDLRVARVVWRLDGTVLADRPVTAPDATTLRVSPPSGEHTVTATVVDAVGQSASDSLSVRATPPSDGGGNDTDGPADPVATPPTARVDLDRTTVCVGAALAADPSDSADTDAVGAAPAEAIEYTRWRIDDRRYANNTGTPTASVVFRQPGAHDLSLTVVDDDGQRDTLTRAVTVLPTGESDCASTQPPVADIAHDGDGTLDPGTRLQFDGSGSFDGDNPAQDGSEIVSYTWSVAGDRVGNGETLRHSFSVPGEYRVSLSVVDDEGATDTARTTITVRDREDSNGTDDGSDSGSGTRDETTFSEVEVVGPVQYQEIIPRGSSDTTTGRLRYKLCVRKSGEVGDQTNATETGCVWPTSLSDSRVTLRWEYGPDGQTRTRTLDTGTTYLRFAFEDDRAFGERRVEVTVTGDRVENGRISDVDTVKLCVAEAGDVEDESLFPEWCTLDTEPGTNDIDVSVEGDTGPVTEGARVTNTVTVDNIGQYDRHETDWVVTGLAARQEGSGDEYTWTASNAQNYSVAYEVTAEVTARKHPDVSDTDSGTLRLDVCGGNSTVDDGECVEDTDQERGDGDKDDSGDDGGDGGDDDDPPDGCQSGDFCSSPEPGDDEDDNKDNDGGNDDRDDDNGDDDGGDPPDKCQRGCPVPESTNNIQRMDELPVHSSTILPDVSSNHPAVYKRGHRSGDHDG